MKKWLFSFAFLTSLYALPVGNPAAATLYRHGVFWNPCSVSPCSPFFPWADALNFRFGYYGDFVFDRRMTETFLGDRLGEEGQTAMQTNAFLAVSNICSWMDVFATFGATNVVLKGRGKETNTWREVHFSPDFSWSVGARATLYKNGPLYVGGEAQYFRTEPDVNAFLDAGSGLITYFNSTNPMIMEEWQVGFGAALEIVNSGTTAFVPYGAVKFSQGKFNLNGFEFTHNTIAHRLPDLVPTNYFGYAIGMSCLLQEALGVAVEGRWLDETALFVYGEFRF